MQPAPPFPQDSGCSGAQMSLTGRPKRNPIPGIGCWNSQAQAQCFPRPLPPAQPRALRIPKAPTQCDLIPCARHVPQSQIPGTSAAPVSPAPRGTLLGTHRTLSFGWLCPAWGWAPQASEEPSAPLPSARQRLPGPAQRGGAGGSAPGERGSRQPARPAPLGARSLHCVRRPPGPRTRRHWPRGERSLETSRGRSPSLEPVAPRELQGARLLGRRGPPWLGWGHVSLRGPPSAPRVAAEPLSRAEGRPERARSGFREPRAGVAPARFSRYF